METKFSDLDPETFYTPEFLAPILGYKKTELRRYCRESGINTRLSKNSIMLDVEDAKRLKEWVKTRNAPTVAELDENPFL